MKAKELVTAYYSAFNRRDAEALLSLLHDDVTHDINQGKTEKGKNSFRDFLGVMDAHYEETAKDLVVMVSDDDKRASAEFRIEGTYKRAQPGLPPAKGQKYSLPVGAFFEIADGKIKRVTNYYNLTDWIAQVSR
jgi:steroid delta-isomerase-like uncharacterized protein